MKHKPSVILLLIVFFVIAQFVGLLLIDHAATPAPLSNNQTRVVTFAETAAGPRPQLTGMGTIIYLLVGIAVATALLLGLIKLKFGGKLWKLWYFLAVVTALTIAFGVFLPKLVALLIAILFALFKIIKYNFFVHNFSELFMYAGLAVLLAPLLTVFWAIILLLAISLYDAYAVWKSKHMIKLAQFTTKQDLFAGLIVKYTDRTVKKSHNKKNKKSEHQSNKKIKTQSRQAILGGGDIVFPLLFLGTILIHLLQIGFSKTQALALSSIVLVVITGSLTLLFVKGKKEKYYPAMPFLTIGCLAGYILLEAILRVL